MTPPAAADDLDDALPLEEAISVDDVDPVDDADVAPGDAPADAPAVDAAADGGELSLLPLTPPPVDAAAIGLSLDPAPHEDFVVEPVAPPAAPVDASAIGLSLEPAPVDAFVAQADAWAASAPPTPVAPPAEPPAPEGEAWAVAPSPFAVTPPSSVQIDPDLMRDSAPPSVVIDPSLISDEPIALAPAPPRAPPPPPAPAAFGDAGALAPPPLEAFDLSSFGTGDDVPAPPALPALADVQLAPTDPLDGEKPKLTATMVMKLDPAEQKRLLALLLEKAQLSADDLPKPDKG